MAIRIRKFKRLYEDAEQQPAAPQQQPQQGTTVPQNQTASPQTGTQPAPQQGQQSQQNQGQQSQQNQGQQQEGNGVNPEEIKNQVIKANQTILQTILEAIEKNVKPIKGVTQEDQDIPASKECAAAYNNLTQKKDFAAVGQFLTALNNYATNVAGGQQGQQQGNGQQPQQGQQQQQQPQQNQGQENNNPAQQPQQS